MPTLAMAKRRTRIHLSAERLSRTAAVLRAGADETALCAVLGASILFGLILNAALLRWWTDPQARVVVAVFA